MSKIICLGDNSYKKWLGEDLLNKFEEANGLVIFTGGDDVPPMLYKEPNSHSYVHNIHRTNKEISNYYSAMERGIPIIGICRGSQFITAMQPNGRVVQDITDHAISGTHSIETEDGRIFEATSTHHQMMYPWDIPNYELIAWSKVRRSKHYLGGNGEYDKFDIVYEPEIVYYPKSRALAIQLHPEFDNCPENTREYCRNLVREYLL